MTKTQCPSGCLDGQASQIPLTLQNLSDQARLPSMTDFHVITGSFRETLKAAPKGDINIFGLAQNTLPFEFIREVTELTRSSCIFVRDSGRESALA